ncbi:Multiple antibiotic resistance protein MarR [Phaeobacter sp. CECT 5382]|uniref:MarR family winged helix-turn-helix transcriptional regulator n=1 Tax=Phaeobacter sp. CECT 5382 TaxID=1712645 RepID=UPI0006DB383B|nr:MarR family transcriptional regulator [Phaeobacter sp. CECT 5382]CUH88861.1 Multiple antibiotic resistance protein MarR [Phaeobacter sp. CECT 5382]
MTDVNTPDLMQIFDTIEYPEAYRITYLANAIVFPAYADIKKDFGLVRAEYILLACLSHFDVLTAQEVARISRRPRNTISRAVHRMLDEGYLDRAPDPHDGRQARLRITSSGRKLHDKISGYLSRRQDEVLGNLNADERQSLTHLLKKAALHAANLDN